MNTAHQAGEHQERLQDFLEEADPRAALQASTLSDCEACRVQLEQLLSLREALDRVGEEERASLEQAKVTPSPLPEGHVKEALRGVEPALSRSSWRFHPGWLVAVAAAAALLMFLPLDEREAALDDLRPLSGAKHATQLLRPVKTGDGLENFEWIAHGDPNASYKVKVYAADDREHALVVSDIIRARCTWKPTQEQLDTLGQREILWQVEVSLDAADTPDLFWSSAPFAP